ncbi:tail fiber protein [Aquimarina sp. 2201CG5-10]|uniref:tail fiber protein n=1 Tax=Aquimarina callyspongiae TaxID=3098150 RepID=UPI002AB5125E|nr:tail fiber protein [Aquimarina sp. 2201CG5-10]MDY8138775.1 tail fiber protein [Aquimarina sp. 2201CG5-10]
MKKSLLFLGLVLYGSGVFGQVNLNSSTGRVQDINTDFSFRITDKQYDRVLFQSGWLSGVGDYVYLKHGGGNVESTTFGFRISDGYGFDFGKNDFATSFFKIKTNGYVGVGISNPSERFEVLGTAKINAIGTRGSSILKLDRGDEGKDAAVISYGQNNIYSWNTGLLYDGGSPTTSFHISQNRDIRDGSGNSVHQPEFTINTSGNIGIGTTTPDSKLTVKGKIHAEEVKIDLSVPAPDYVFLKDYDLKSIGDVEAYIKQEGHLPNIPSAAAMEANGVELGIMNMKLLEKIEELTLYTIAQEKRIHQLEQKEVENQKLEAKNAELEARLAKIESLVIKK